jgi:hypothetical protein
MFVGQPAMHTLDNFYVACFPSMSIEQIDTVVLDTNVIKEIDSFFDTNTSSQVTPNLLRFLRKVEVYSTPALLEGKWQNTPANGRPIAEYISPITSGMVRRFELLHYVQHCSGEDFSRLINGDTLSAKISKVSSESQVRALRQEFDVSDWVTLIAQNWYCVASLMLEYSHRPVLSTSGDTQVEIKSKVDEQIIRYKRWQRQLLDDGVGISADIRFLANLLFFGGYMPGIHQQKVIFEDLVKVGEWKSKKKSAIARNVAFDFNYLSLARQLRMGWINNEDTGRHKFAAILTTDRNLVAMEGFKAQELLQHGAGILVSYKWPLLSDFTRVYEEKFAYGFLSRPRNAKDLLASEDLLPGLEVILSKLDTY